MTIGDIRRAIKDLDDSVPVVIRRLSKTKGRVLHEVHSVRLSSVSPKGKWVFKIDLGKVYEGQKEEAGRRKS